MKTYMECKGCNIYTLLTVRKYISLIKFPFSVDQGESFCPDIKIRFVQKFLEFLRKSASRAVFTKTNCEGLVSSLSKSPLRRVVYNCYMGISCF